MSPVLALLNEIRPRPLAMYVGEQSLTKLAMYLYGYEHAVENLTGTRDDFLFHFREWLEGNRLAKLWSSIQRQGPNTKRKPDHRPPSSGPSRGKRPSGRTALLSLCFVFFGRL